MPATQRFPLTQVRVECDDGIATVTIRRPEALNSLSPVLLHQLYCAIEQVTADPQVRGIVLGGQGKAFVVGADLGFFLRNIEAGDLERIVKFTELGHRLMNAIDACPKPVVARVDGVAIGGGVELALACDHVVATPQASFSLPETGLGIYPGFGGTQRTPRAVGTGLAKWMIFTGATVPAAVARTIGLVDQVVPAAEAETMARRWALGQALPTPAPGRSADLIALEALFALQRVDEFHAGRVETQGNRRLEVAAKHVTTKAPIALRFAERFINQGMDQPLAAGLQLEIDSVIPIFSTQDAYRGLSFRASRQLGTPRFEGC